MKHKSLRLLTVSIVAVVVCTAIFQRPLAIAYHKWRMDAEYNTIFGNPEPAVNGLTPYDVTGIDVDAVLESYMHHREVLVDFGVLCHVTASFPSLVSDGSEPRSSARSNFVQQMWAVFPGHQHYHLSSDGHFEAWAPLGQKLEWQRFLQRESEPTK